MPATELAAAIMTHRARGETWTQVAAALGMHPVTLWRWRKQHAEPATSRRANPQWQRVEAEYGEPVRAVILGLRAIGYSWSTVAAALDISERTLVNWRRALGLPLDKRARQSDPEWTVVLAAEVTDWLRGTTGRHIITRARSNTG